MHISMVSSEDFVRKSLHLKHLQTLMITPLILCLVAQLVFPGYVSGLYNQKGGIFLVIKVSLFLTFF